MPKISDKQLKNLFSSGGIYNPIYKDSCDLYNELKIHSQGLFPEKLIGERRPSETQEILEYRKKVYKPITKHPLSKVINCYGKIRRSPDWNINFPKENISAKITADETLEKYCTENLPSYISITNWAFDILLPQNLLDANAVVAVIPLANATDADYLLPVPLIFNSDSVIYFSESEQFCVLKSARKSVYQNDNKDYLQGDIFWYIDDTEIIRYEQDIKGYNPKITIPNKTGVMPAFRVKSERYKQFDDTSLNRSRLHAMVPFLDDAAAEYSDLKGSKIQHLYPFLWVVSTKDCPECRGTGSMPGAEGEGPTKCGKCEGGKIKFSPFTHLEINQAELSQNGPFPFNAPAGYVQRDTEILELQDKSVDKNILKALSALNMQFLDQTPLSISGDAKNVDREELNNTVFVTAEDIVYSVDKVINLINEWRYYFILPDKTSRKKMLPNIPVPQNFDLLPSDYLVKEIKEAKDAGVSSLIISTLEQELAAKKFYNHPELAAKVKLFHALDPLAGTSVDDRMSMLSNKGITVEDYVLSNYMMPFLNHALREDPGFGSQKYDQQMGVLKKFAEEKIQSEDPVEELKNKQQIIDEGAAK